MPFASVHLPLRLDIKVWLKMLDCFIYLVYIFSCLFQEMSPLALQSSQLDDVYPEMMDDNSMSMSERNMGMSDAGYPSYGIGEGQFTLLI